MSRRTGVVGIIMVLLFIVIAFQDANVQFWRASALDASQYNPRNIDISQNYPRGEIVAANGQVLAQSVRTGYPDGEHPWKRKYPLGALTSAVVGLSANYYLWGGIEDEYNSQLEAHKLPAQSFTQDLTPQVGADSVSITLEPALQRVAAEQLGGRDGAVVAIDPQTGAILALYSNPTYNDNTITAHGYAPEVRAWNSYNKPDSEDFNALTTLATEDTFPPGSTFKVITTAAVVAHDPTLFYEPIPSRECLSLEPYSTKCLQNDGGVACGGDIPVMLPESCDPGYAQLGLDLGGDTLTAEALAFGYDVPIPVDLPGVAQSSFPNRHVLTSDPPELAYSAIGQENVRTSALQNAMVAAAIADGGKMMTPHFLNQIMGPSGNILETYKPTLWKQALSPAQAARIVPLMESVVTDGTASGVGFLYADDVAAKTGTAQTGNAVNNTDDWMIAFAPATDPVIAIAVVVPYQVVSATGAEVAGPIMKCMVESAIAMNEGQPVSNTATTCPS